MVKSLHNQENINKISF